MTTPETENELQPKPKRRTRPRPDAEIAKRRAARKERGALDYGFNKRLGLDESKLDHANYAYYWANDDGANISLMEGREWEHVASEDVGGQEVSRLVGTTKEGKPMSAKLMRKWRPWYDEDAAGKLQMSKERDEALQRQGARGSEEVGRSEVYQLQSNSITTDNSS